MGYSARRINIGLPAFGVAFPKGKQNEEINKTTIILLSLVDSVVLKYFKYIVILNSYNSLFNLFMHN
jgi:hypothetical protein